FAVTAEPRSRSGLCREAHRPAPSPSPSRRRSPSRLPHRRRVGGWPMPIARRRRDFATDIVRRLRNAGHQALWAGGSVRDLLRGEAPSDYDVATSATPEQVMHIFRYRTIPVGAAFGVVRVRSQEADGDEVEVATFRSDGAYVDGRRPTSVVFS